MNHEEYSHIAQLSSPKYLFLVLPFLFCYYLVEICLN